MSRIGLFMMMCGCSIACNENGTVAGRVVDRLSGKPIAGATAVAGLPPIQVTTGSDGTFVLDDVVPGSHTVTVSKLGYASLSDANAVVTKHAKTAVADLFLIEEPKAPGLYDISTGTYGRKFEPSEWSKSPFSDWMFIGTPRSIALDVPIPKPIDLLLVTDRRIVAGPITFGPTKFVLAAGKLRCARNVGPPVEVLGQRFVRIRGDVAIPTGEQTSAFCVTRGHPAIQEVFLVTVIDPKAVVAAEEFDDVSP
ncbi:MAG: carboxypeptidase regulatory-like domain-containing protein [Candidatus Magasanikbacteria bacterium]|nr:carboxypeptidase regulatory-like domain-containing protein [Candidatus Magasanikbacteria bacterium]